MAPPGGGRPYLADFSWVRRQRVQTRALVGCALLHDDERLEVRLHAAVRSDAVHPRRLGVEAAHRCLAADRAGASHAWSSGVDRDGGSPCRAGPNGAVEYHTASDAPLGRSPTPLSEEDVARVPSDPTPGRSLVTRRAVRDIVRTAVARLVRRDRVRRRSRRAPPRPARPRASRASTVRLGDGLDDRPRPDRRLRRAGRRGRPPGRLGRPLRAAARARPRGRPAGHPRRRPPGRPRAARRRRSSRPTRAPIRPRDLADSGTDVA